MNLRDRRVLVVGGSGGLGPSIVEACLALGAHVIAVGRRKTRLNELLARNAQHERLEVAECDVSDAVGTARLVEALERKGPIDGVVQAAGAFVFGRLTDLSEDDIDRMLTQNLRTTIVLLRAIVPPMMARKAGSIVVVASDRALDPEIGFSIYGAAKAGVVHLVQSVAKECLAYNVRINALLPSIIDTPDNRGAMPKADPSLWVSPQAIARAAAWLLTEDARGTSGSLLRFPSAT